MSVPTLAELAQSFLQFSLLAVGGANALLPEMYRQVVENQRWLSSSEFATLYAITQAAPGPNVLLVALIGWKMQGVAGALVSLFSMITPSSLIVFGVGKLWFRFRHSPWRKVVERALAPITIGLILGSGCLLMNTTATSLSLYGVALATTAAGYFLRHNPLWWVALAALLGALGWV